MAFGLLQENLGILANYRPSHLATLPSVVWFPAVLGRWADDRGEW
jgi:hypothetical protein